MKNSKLTFILLFTFLVTGCDSRNVAWFDRHPRERDIKLHQCVNMSDERRKQDYECMAANVSAARSHN